MQKNWVVLEDPPQAFLDEFPNLPPIVARLLFHRNLKTQEKIDEFLNPDYSKDVHDPYLFQDMKKAVDRIFKAIENNEKITVHGDYDADGVSASVILTSLFRALDYDNTNVFLPHRETDGYGLNNNTIELLANEGTKLIISCDCGISNKEEVDLANKLNIDVIITDHHTIPALIPEAYAIIHPKIEGEPYPDKNLAGGAVAFKLMQAILLRHKEKNEKLPNGESHAAFEKWQLDMAAIASVADMVPLVGESRTLTKYGLIVLNKAKRVGMKKLLLEARILEEDGTMKKEITADTIGFQIAPRINAAGRMNHANVAYNLFVTNDATKAVDLAYELDQNNNERRTLTEDLVSRATEQIERDQLDNPVLFAIGKDWSTGIVGLVSGRLKEKFQKPTIAMANNNGVITGSGRSIEGFNLIEGLQEMPDFFLKFGGHPMACGFTLESSVNLEDFKQALIEKYKKKTAGKDMDPRLEIDAEVSLDEVDWKLYDLLEKFSPFGQGNPRPNYLVKGAEIINVSPLGKEGKHMKLMVKHESNRIRKFVGWQMCKGNDANWCENLKSGEIVDIVFEIGVNEWNGNRELQLTITDIKI